MDDTDLLDHSKFLSDHSNACQFPSLQSQSQSTNWTASEISNQNTTDNGLALNFPKPLGPSDPVPPHVDSGPSNQIKLGPSGMQSGLADAFDSSQKCAFEKIISFDGHVPSLADAQPPSACPGYLSNRRSVPSALRSSISQPSLQPSLNSAEQQSGSRGLSEKYLEAYPPLKRTSSFVRLSMSLDGKAKVTINNDNSPSPPRIQPSVLSAKTSRSGPLQRSQSAIEPGDRPKENQNMAFIPWPRRTISGRSRDARAWEFYCDSDARNALTEHAEQEQSGSAVGAIALMRSRTKNMLASNKNKRNLQTSKAETVKRVKASGFSKTEKPKLYRSSSSTARLQSVSGENRKQQSNSKNQIPKDGTKSVIFRSPSGDSDKENWEPGSHTGNSRRRQVPRVQCNTQRPILKENPRIPSQSSSLGAVLNRENMTPGRDRRKAADSAEEDGEVAAFMGESSVRREEEDLDCVQNLLSLSQGAWR